MEWAWSGLTGQGSGLTGQAKALACQAGLTGRLAYGSPGHRAGARLHYARRHYMGRHPAASNEQARAARPSGRRSLYGPEPASLDMGMRGPLHGHAFMASMPAVIIWASVRTIYVHACMAFEPSVTATH